MPRYRCDKFCSVCQAFPKEKTMTFAVTSLFFTWRNEKLSESVHVTFDILRIREHPLAHSSWSILFNSFRRAWEFRQPHNKDIDLWRPHFTEGTCHSVFLKFWTEEIFSTHAVEKCWTNRKNWICGLKSEEGLPQSATPVLRPLAKRRRIKNECGDS